MGSDGTATKQDLDKQANQDETRAQGLTDARRLVATAAPVPAVFPRNDSGVIADEASDAEQCRGIDFLASSLCRGIGVLLSHLVLTLSIFFFENFLRRPLHLFSEFFLKNNLRGRQTSLLQVASCFANNLGQSPYRQAYAAGPLHGNSAARFPLARLVRWGVLSGRWGGTKRYRIGEPGRTTVLNAIYPVNAILAGTVSEPILAIPIC